MSADHKKPSYAFAGLVVLAASVVGIQVRADADLSEQAIASDTVLNAAAPDHEVWPVRGAAGPAPTVAAGHVTLDGLEVASSDPGSTSGIAAADAGTAGSSGVAASRRSDRAVTPSRSASRAHAHDERRLRARTDRGGADGAHGAREPFTSAWRGRSDDTDRVAPGHAGGPRHRGESHGHGHDRGHR